MIENSASLPFLKKAAKDLGVIDAKAISAFQVFVENQTPLKCRTDCIGYGKKLTCPPFVPNADEFRKIVSEYRYALLVKFLSRHDRDGYHLLHLQVLARSGCPY